MVNGSEGELDTHWMPISSHCRPCWIEYDAVLKVEALAVDFAAMRRWLPDLLSGTELKWLQQERNQGLFSMWNHGLVKSTEFLLEITRKRNRNAWAASETAEMF